LSVEQVQTNWATGIPPAAQFSRLTGLPLDLIQSINNQPWLYTKEEIEHYENLENKYGFHYKQSGNSIRGDRITLVFLSGNFLWYIEPLLVTGMPILLSGRNPYNTSRSYLPKWVLVCEQIPSALLVGDPVVILGNTPTPQYLHTQLVGPDPGTTIKLFFALLDFFSFQSYQLFIGVAK
jgi:hypothetical protein